jgi:hypothetical protein
MHDSDASGTTRRRAGRPRGLPPEDHTRSYRGKRSFSAAEIKQVLHLNFGNPHLTAVSLCDAEKKAGGDRTICAETVRHYMRTRPAFQEIARSGRNEALDLAEGVVIQALHAGDIRTARWLLEQLGKDRGYGKGGLVPGGLMVIDPADLPDDQLRMIFDPDRLSDRQMDIILEMLLERMGPKAGPIIDAETIS